VRAEIVQLPGDPDPFLGDPLFRDPVPLRGEQGQPLPAGPHHLTDQEHRHEDPGRTVQRHVQRTQPRDDHPAVRVHDDEQTGHHETGTAARRGGDRVERDPHRDGGRATGIPIHVVREEQHRHHGQHRRRPSPPHQQGHCHAGDHRVREGVRRTIRRQHRGGRDARRRGHERERRHPDVTHPRPHGVTVRNHVPAGIPRTW
jgi:hypothetical protein